MIFFIFLFPFVVHVLSFLPSFVVVVSTLFTRDSLIAKCPSRIYEWRVLILILCHYKYLYDVDSQHKILYKDLLISEFNIPSEEFAFRF